MMYVKITKETTMKKKIFMLLITLLVLFVSSISYAEEYDIERISGKTRFETAVEISRHEFRSSDTVILVNGYSFPDGICGTVLAAKYSAPILLSSAYKIPDCTKNEIIRLGAKNIIILGGKGVISKEIENELSDDYICERFGGKNRYETSLLIAKEIESDEVFLTSGSNFQKSLLISPYASKNQIPIVLSPKYNIPSSTVDYLSDKLVTILEPEEKISFEVANNFYSKRIAFSGDIEQDIIDISKKYSVNPSAIVLANRNEFPDSLSGYIVAYNNDAPFILVNPKIISKKLLKHIENTGVNKIIILGGKGAVSKKIIKQIEGGSENYDQYANPFKKNISTDMLQIRSNDVTRKVLEKITITSVVNKCNRLPDSYTVNNLVEVPHYGSWRMYLAPEAASQWKKMFAKSEEAGLRIYLVDAFRTEEDQQWLFDYNYSNDPDWALRYVAFPRSSEHEMGLAVDISYDESLPQNFYSTPIGKFLDKNAHKYGFILRYPEGKSAITGISPESWHYRYVGVELATELKQTGQTLEEYYDLVKE